LQDFLMNSVYLSGDSAKREKETRQIIRELFAAFVADPKLLPPRYQRRIDSDGLYRVVCDYIAGMTDRYCRQEHEKIVRSA
jgi:dGTPase